MVSAAAAGRSAFLAFPVLPTPMFDCEVLLRYFPDFFFGKFCSAGSREALDHRIESVQSLVIVNRHIMSEARQ
jgi:hypothetical protein